MTATRILVAGDLHLGRSSSRVPDTPELRDLSTATAWDAIVDCAIERSVQFLLLSGDIADADNRFWESIGPLERGIRRLADADITTVAVAGNHDHDVLPRLVAALDRPDAFRLLGRGGRWERYAAVDDGRTVFHVDGWSFPGPAAEESPLASYAPAPPPDDAPVIGLVHGDLDQRTSRYAPLARAGLEAQPVAAWILGHVHAPQLLEGRPWILYPGSPQALDPGEPGRHGAWLLEIDGGVVRTPHQVGLSTVRYEHLALDVTGADDRESFDRLLSRSVRDRAEAIVAERDQSLRHLVLRVVLEGRSGMHDLIVREAEAIARGLRFAIEGVEVAVERLDDHVLPAIDLEAYARGPTVVNELTRLLLDLNRPSPAVGTSAVLDRARSAMAAERERPEYLPLSADDALAADRVRAAVIEEARHLLGVLLEQES